MSVVFSHPTGNSFVRAAAKGLADTGSLLEFHTSIASFPGSLLDRLGTVGPLAEIRRRGYEPALRPFTHTRPWLEVGRLVASKAGFKRLTKHEEGIFCVDAVYRDLDKKVATRLKRSAQKGAKAVYAYEDEALYSFRAAKKFGLKCFYDLPIGYWRTAAEMLQNELERWPEWVSTMPNFDDSAAKLERKDEELRLADRIIVASSFTANTLKQFPGNLSPVEVIPYGFPKVAEAKKYFGDATGRPLKLLFVGGLSQRKGIADLFEVVNTLGRHVTLTVVGRKPSGNCIPLNTALAQHTWIPSLPQEDIFKLMRESDVLIFPSLFEGFGLVITEAMAQGTPVITTERTAGPDIIEHGRNGWLTEAGSTQALLQSIEVLLQQPTLITAAGKEAMETAKLRSWEVYGKELARSIRSRY